MPAPPSPWCSVIIPTLNEAHELGATLDRLGAASTDLPFEVIVVDGDSEDTTPDVARRHGARVVTASRGRARQMNAGARVARGKFLYFLHADTRPPVDWLTLLNRSDRPGCFRLGFGEEERNVWLRLFAYLSRFRGRALRYGDQSLWVLRTDFEAVGGYREDHRLLEGNELCRRLERYRGSLRVVAAPVATSARKYHRNGVVYTQLVYVLLYVLYRFGVGQDRLWGIYTQRLR